MNDFAYEYPVWAFVLLVGFIISSLWLLSVISPPPPIEKEVKITEKEIMEFADNCLRSGGISETTLKASGVSARCVKFNKPPTKVNSL